MRRMWLYIIGSLVLVSGIIPLAYYQIVPPFYWILVFIVAGIAAMTIKVVQILAEPQNANKGKVSGKSAWMMEAEHVNALLQAHPAREPINLRDNDKSGHDVKIDYNPVDYQEQHTLYAFYGPGQETRSMKLAIYDAHPQYKDVVHFDPNPSREKINKPFMYYSLFSDRQLSKHSQAQEREQAKDEKELKMYVKDTDEEEREEQRQYEGLSDVSRDQEFPQRNRERGR